MPDNRPLSAMSVMAPTVATNVSALRPGASSPVFVCGDVMGSAILWVSSPKRVSKPHPGPEHICVGGNFLVSREPLSKPAPEPVDTKHDHDTCVAEAVAAAEALAAASTVRLTRRRVLELVCESHRPVGAYDLLSRLGGERKTKAAPPTVYRALDFLMEQGLIHRINSLNAYVACFGPHRPHDACLLICERCRTVDESEAESVRRAIDKRADEAGFRVRQRTVEITGLCRACAGER